MFDAYFERIAEIFQRIRQQEKEHITQAAQVIVAAIQRGNAIFAFGASHAGIITEELCYRAGGCVLINPILDPALSLATRPITATSVIEQLHGYGAIIFDKYPIRPGDVVICHSVSGRNPVVVDFALAVKERSTCLIGITNLQYSQTITSRHRSGKRLFELCDIVIDNCGDIGDACLNLGEDNSSQKVIASSTLTGVAIANSMMAMVAELLHKEGWGIEQPLPFFVSANADGGKEQNQKILEHYRRQIYYLD